uniref:DCD domain-containing protein n=1 Tax=Schistosoma mansoni TaxID=6183 RepID=A0A3Q0KS50_SCHMA
MSKNAKKVVGEKLQFEDVVKFTGSSICKSHGDKLKETAATLILTKVDSKLELSSQLKCYETYISFYPEILVTGIRLEGRISLQEILGFFVSPKHPKALVILFQRSPLEDVTLYGMVLSSSSKAQKLARFLTEPNPQLNVKGEPSGPKVKSVTIGPNIRKSPESCYKESNGVLKTHEVLNTLPPTGNKFRSEVTWNKMPGKQKEKFPPGSTTVHFNGRLPREDNQLKFGRQRIPQVKSTHLMNSREGMNNNHPYNGSNISKLSSFYPESAKGHVSFRQSTAGYNDKMLNYSNGPIINSERASEESGFDTPFPYDPNENIEEFSIGYYNTEDGFGIDDRDILHKRIEKEIDTNDSQENPWVENITYISNNKNGKATVTSNGSVYLYVAQQVNPRFETISNKSI